MRILIAGCGDVGTGLGRLLAERGHEVWGLRRRPEELPAPIRPLAADLANPDTLRSLPECDYVAYTAAADGRDEEAYRRAYVEGVSHLLEALTGRERPLRRFFLTSSTGVYGQDRGEWIDESSPAEPRSFTGKILLEGERRVSQGPFASTVVRLAGIYGPGRTRLVDQVRSGRARIFERASYTNRIHRDDCAGFLAHLIGADLAGTPPERLYVGVDDDPAERGHVLGWLAERLGVPRPPVERDPVGRDPVERDPVEEREPSGRGMNKRCRNDKLRSTGYRLKFPTFREGYAAMLSS